MRYWVGKVPAHDDFGRPITEEFIDGRTKMGSWAYMTPASHAIYGVGIGPGSGQRYKLTTWESSPRFMKVEG